MMITCVSFIYLFTKSIYILLIVILENRCKVVANNETY